MKAPGADPASRLVSTMLDVLVAEMAEPGRLRRGRAYALQGAVDGLRVEPGVVSAHVQGSSPRPYVAMARVPVVQPDGPRMAALLPDRAQLRFTCTCPDDDLPCKHGVAVMAAFSERVAYDGRMFVLWRTGIDPTEEDWSAPTARGRAADAPAAGAGGIVSPGAVRIGAGRWSPPAEPAGLDEEARAALAAHLGEGLGPIPATPELPELPAPRAAWDEVWAGMLESALEALQRPAPPPRRR